MVNTTIYVTYNRGDKNEFSLRVDGNYPIPEKASTELTITRVDLIQGSLTDLIFEGITIESLTKKCSVEMSSDMSDYWENASDSYGEYD